MDNFFKKLKQAHQKVVFDPNRKKELRAYLLHMTKADQSIRERQSQSGLIFKLRLASPVVAIVFLVTGTSFAAEGALPGDLLYPIKVSVNESVVSALSFSNSAKAEWETRLAERRLNEVATLTARGSIDEKIEQDLEDEFEKHIERANAHIAKMSGEGHGIAAADIASDLETSRSIRKKIVAKKQETIAMMSASLSQEAVPVQMMVVRKIQEPQQNEYREVFLDDFNSDAGLVNKQEAAQGRLRAVSVIVNQTRLFLNKKKDQLDLQIVQRAEARLRFAEKALAEAQFEMDEGRYDQAFQSSNRAHQLSKEAKLILETNINLNSDDESEQESDVETTSGDEAEDNDDSMPMEIPVRIAPLRGF